LSEEALLSRYGRGNQLQLGAAVCASVLGSGYGEALGEAPSEPRSSEELLGVPSCLESSWKAEGARLGRLPQMLILSTCDVKRRLEKRMIRQSGNRLTFV
jgi:hypothetical protein